MVEAFLTAARGGNFDALLAVLDPEVVLRRDPMSVPAGGAGELHGAAVVAKQFVGRAQATQTVVLQEIAKKETGCGCSSPSFLHGRSKQRGNQCDLPSDISFCHPLYLPFPQDVHYLVSL
ncbi:hypothetical protein KSD_80100 [Ktedonobacter sp. SOSP1-85]|nr:hypothetical protein KSD_80100 [Ktedonobacter sp. SOSP1-85]